MYDSELVIAMSLDLFELDFIGSGSGRNGGSSSFGSLLTLTPQATVVAATISTIIIPTTVVMVMVVSMTMAPKTSIDSLLIAFWNDGGVDGSDRSRNIGRPSQGYGQQHGLHAEKCFSISNS